MQQVKRIFRQRPKARLKLGRTYRGKKTALIAQGVAVFKEWDAIDKQFYYWEEWELTGFDDYDSWIEYDHYTRKITRYEPIRVPEVFYAKDLTAGQVIHFTFNNQPVMGTVKEVGTASVDYLRGKMSYQLFEDDSFTYATVQTPIGELSIEDYRINGAYDHDYYLGKTMTAAQQRAVFGKTIKPRNLTVPITLAATAGFFIIPMAIPNYETVCTPRTATAATSQNATNSNFQTATPTPSSSSNQTCTRRRVYGGGGGGVGK